VYYFILLEIDAESFIPASYEQSSSDAGHDANTARDDAAPEWGSGTPTRNGVSRELL